jgi:hypothetical protein
MRTESSRGEKIINRSLNMVHLLIIANNSKRISTEDLDSALELTKAPVSRLDDFVKKNSILQPKY